ncbi:MAG: hypothetical protein IKP28_00355 [Clostridia bacterium]|nr:hypothetical protein [Clostridia bacterium]
MAKQQKKGKRFLFSELQETGFYFRWAHVHTDGTCDEISIERIDLEAQPDFEKLLIERGYKKRKGREENYTDQFYWPGKL